MVKVGMEMDKDRLSQAMSACVDNGQRLRQDAEWLEGEGPATAYALCILAQEEFAKAFLLHLIWGGIVPWTSRVRKSLYSHRHKQIIGLVMEWLSPTDDEYFARSERRRQGQPSLPGQVIDALKLYVDSVRLKGHIPCLPAASDARARGMFDGDLDSRKQDALYVRLSGNAEIISTPSSISAELLAELLKEEMDKTARLGNLVKPLRKGSLGPAVDYDLVREALTFLLLDKSHRPFLLWANTALEGLHVSPDGTTCPHSIVGLVQNVSAIRATSVTGSAALFSGREVMKPFFRFTEFAVDPGETVKYALRTSEETFARVTNSGEPFMLHADFDYCGDAAGPTYKMDAWITYDAVSQTFNERLTHSEKSLKG